MVERGFSPSKDSLGRGSGQDRAQVRSMSGGAMEDSRTARAGAPAPSQGRRAELRDAGCGSFQLGRTDSAPGSKEDCSRAELPEEGNDIVEEQHTTSGAKRHTRAPAARRKVSNHLSPKSSLRSRGGQRETNQEEIHHQEQDDRDEEPEEPYQGPSEVTESTVPNIQRRSGPRR